MQVCPNRRTAHHRPEGSRCIERFHGSLNHEEAWTADYRNLKESRASIDHWIQEYNHGGPHRGVRNRIPHEAFWLSQMC